MLQRRRQGAKLAASGKFARLGSDKPFVEAYGMTHPSPADRDLRQMIEALCPGRSEEELRDAERRFMAYVRLVNRICTRLEAEDRAERPPAGTPPRQDSTEADGLLE